MELTKGQNTLLPVATIRASITWQPTAQSPVVDVVALLLDATGKVRGDEDLVFYNQPSHPSGSVTCLGNDGGADRVVVNIDKLPVDVARVVVGASTDCGSFGDLQNLKIVLEDATTGQAIAHFPINDATTETAFRFVEIYQRNQTWKIRAVGQGYSSGLAGFAMEFGVDIDDAPPSPEEEEPSKQQRLVDMEKRVAAQAPELLSLTKKAAISLQKRGLGLHTAQVALCLDVSGSMSELFESGKIQALAERVLALGMRFDDNEEIEVFLFADKAKQFGSLRLSNMHSFIEQAWGASWKLGGGTRYGPAMRLIRRHYFDSDTVRREPLTREQPVYVMYVTDGAPGDYQAATKHVRSSSYEPLFWQFMAIEEDDQDDLERFYNPFEFLERLDNLDKRYLDNANFFSVKDPAAISDERLFELMMTEYPEWLSKARDKRLLL